MVKQAFSEVIESSLAQWVAQCWQWDTFPDAGTLVVLEEGQRRIFGLMRTIETGSIDTTRSPFAYHKTEEELQRDHPEIFSFLKTTCTCICAGFCEHEGPMLYHQPPRPPKIHAFVRVASLDEKAKFFAADDYLMLLTHRLPPEQLDDLLLATISRQKEYFSIQNGRTFAFFETYMHLTNHDHARLRNLASRIEKML